MGVTINAAAYSEQQDGGAGPASLQRPASPSRARRAGCRRRRLLRLKQPRRHEIDLRLEVLLWMVGRRDDG